MEKKTALITGGSSGIGFELAKQFAQDGFDLVIASSDAEKLGKAAEELKNAFHIAVETHEIDLSVSGSAKELYINLRTRKIDVLVNNAGFGTRSPFAEVPVDQMLGLLRLNMETLTHLTRLILPEMLMRRSGKILNLASTAAFEPGPLMATYFASKAYVLSFSEALAYEVRGSGVSVTALCPGATKTNFEKRAGLEGTKLFSSTMSPKEVAEVGYRALMQGKPVQVVGWKNKLLTFFSPLMPKSVVMSTIFKMNSKK
jgi:short-subunit dehydrogenase